MTFPYLYQEVDRIYAKTIGRGIRTLCVTSSNPGEGTTSVVCALAQRATAVNLNVLIVDLNLHNPVVSRMIDPNESGVEQVSMSSKAIMQHPDDKSDHPPPPPDWDCAINHMAHEITIAGGPGIKVIPRPCADNNPVRFREHAMLNRMISYWQEHHDCIIFDTSPLCLVNQRNIPAQHVATCCDAAVVVVKSGKTQKHQLKEAMEILHTVEVNLAGTVMNDFANPLLGVELIRQCQKLGKRLPRLSKFLINRIKKSAFLFADF
ncbi:MAG: hypothetical protein MJK04_35025 [Psychrosphaera sp.]|nr:hypothetical protein [Psychrosphaera sp.]